MLIRRGPVVVAGHNYISPLARWRVGTALCELVILFLGKVFGRISIGLYPAPRGYSYSRGSRGFLEGTGDGHNHRQGATVDTSRIIVSRGLFLGKVFGRISIGLYPAPRGYSYSRGSRGFLEGTIEVCM